MKAFVNPASGGSTIEPVEIPAPAIDSSEFLVRVHAIGVGIHDSYFLPAGAQYPYPIGIEAAGVVEDVGEAVSEIRAGDRIAFTSTMQPKGGTWAEFAAVGPGSLILHVPEEMSFTTAAALPVVGNTALQALAIAGVQEGEMIFISGGAGAIGTLAIQIAHARGCRVLTSASARNFEYVRSLGADEVVDYHDDDWTRQILRRAPSGVDAAIAIHPGTSEETLAVVKDFGSLVTVSADNVVPERGIRVDTVRHQVDVRDELVSLVDDVATGTIHVEIEHVYPFSEAPAALARVQTRHVRGKLVIQVV